MLGTVLGVTGAAALPHPSQVVGGVSRCSRSKGSALPRSALPSHPWRRLPAVLSLLLSALLALTVFASVSAASDDERATQDRTASAASAGSAAPVQAHAAAASTPLPEPPAADVETPEPFAQIEGLELLLPSHDSVVHGFHEASWGGALAMQPVGEHQRVLPSRGRPNPPTSAVDIVLREDDVVLSPVSGAVEQVERFSLYDRYRDRKVTIVPDDAPELRVVMIHVSAVQVEAGDRVEAGETRVAERARKFPFRSQIDDWTAPQALPHVHVEVKRADAG